MFEFRLILLDRLTYFDVLSSKTIVMFRSKNICDVLYLCTHSKMLMVRMSLLVLVMSVG